MRAVVAVVESGVAAESRIAKRWVELFEVVRLLPEAAYPIYSH